MPYGIKAGYYDAVPTGEVVVVETKPNEAVHGLGMWIHFNVKIDKERTESMRFFANLMFPDQTVSEKSIETLHEVFGEVWKTDDPLDLMGCCEQMKSVKVRVKIVDEEYNGKVHSKIKYINKPKVFDDQPEAKKDDLRPADIGAWSKKIKKSLANIPADAPPVAKAQGDNLPF